MRSYSQFVPIRVVSLELTDGLTPIVGCARYRAVYVLVRLRGVPLEWLIIPAPGDTVPAERVRRALHAQFGTFLPRALLASRLADPAPEPPGPPISVVVCTRDRPERLERCLRSLLALRYPRCEIIVVDNASRSDDTARLAATLPVRYVREERPGLDWARNRGIVETTHDLIAFTDDDVRVDPEWLTGIARAFADPAVMMVTGLVAPAELETEAQLIFERVYGGMGKGLQRRWWRREALTPYELVGAHHLGAGANMAFRREVFERVGTFDPALDVGTPSHGAGDLDIFQRVLVAGLLARYEPSAIVWHEHRREMSALERQLHDNGRAFGVFLITRWRRGDPGRAHVARYALGGWLGWLAARIPRRFLRRERLSLPLQFAEIGGALVAPWASRATERHAREVSERFAQESADRTDGEALRASEWRW